MTAADAKLLEQAYALLREAAQGTDVKDAAAEWCLRAAAQGSSGYVSHEQSLLPGLRVAIKEIEEAFDNNHPTTALLKRLRSRVERLSGGVAFIMGPGGDEGTRPCTCNEYPHTADCGRDISREQPPKG